MSFLQLMQSICARQVKRKHLKTEILLENLKNGSFE